MLALALSACAWSGSGRVQYAAAVTVRSPELVTLEESPDVYVLADADEPVFYTDNYYWLYRDNGWYRSHSYDRDWESVRSPSPRLRNIHSPTAYVRYRSRHQEARNTPTPMPQREPWRDDQPRTDVPQNLPPHAQPPLQPTEPQQAPTPNPMPPQQQPPINDHHIDANAPRSPSSPAPRDQVRRDDVRIPEDGSYERAPGAPAQVKDDMSQQQPPGQVRRDEGSTKVAPGQIKRDERNQEHAEDKAQKQEQRDENKASKQDEKDENKKDKKRDY
jgi:hypothetical protein